MPALGIRLEIAQGKVAFITGGSRGIGLGIAKAFASAGMKIAFSFREPEHRDRALAALGSAAHAVGLDVTDREALRRGIDEIEQALGPIDVLCNNAGIEVLGPADATAIDDWRRVFEVNLFAAVAAVERVVPGMRARGRGHVVNVASVAAFSSWPGTAAYTASKFALRGFSECLRAELVPSGIGVTLVSPGATRTELHRAGDPGEAARIRRALAYGMDPDEVGRRTLGALERGDFYAFTHAETAEGVRVFCGEVLAALPDEAPDDKRLFLERAALDHRARLLRGAP